MTKPNILKFTELIGNTPLIDLSTAFKKKSVYLYAKCEFMNPGLSMKDRVICYILDKAEQEKKLKQGSTIVCASSGNTGCSTAMQGTIRGYNVIIFTSNKCSLEKQNHIRAFNAKLMIVNEYTKHAKQFALENNFFDINQYDNLDNPQAYYLSLGPEIWQQTEHKITHFVMTASTFGCISGVARFLKEKNSKIRIILVDPVKSNISDYYESYKQHTLFQGETVEQHYLIEGAGKDKPTKCTDFSLIDEVVNISDSEAVNCCHQLAKTEGLITGGSSGLNIAACFKLSETLNQGVIVSILCDHGIKYLSKIYDSSFLKKQKIGLF
jgi:cysteine synthase